MANAFAAPTYGTPPAASTDSTATVEARGAALEFLRRLATEVSKGTVDLPCFPKVVIQIRKALADPSTTAEQTVTIVGAEPRLAARLLQTANSTAFNLSGKPLTDLRSAITRLGHQMVQSAAMAFAVQQMKDEQSLRCIAQPMSDLWTECISVASISQIVARRTKVSPEEAFLTGLLHGIGRLYIMVRAVAGPTTFGGSEPFLDLIAGWHASIGKAVLENWSFAEQLCEAVGEQGNHERQRKHEADLSDVLIASIVLAKELNITEPRIVDIAGISAFQRIGLTANNCTPILKIARHQLASLHNALGC
jgi:HD-like signal output (HDOD) protein